MIPAIVLDLKNIRPPETAPKAAFQISAPLGIRVVSAFAVCSVGLYYLASGKEKASLQRMAVGTVLIFASLFLI